MSSLPTTSQVTGLVWSHHSKEIVSTHGYPDNHFTLWSYPALTKIHTVNGAHEKRILGSAISPDGFTLVTGAADENLKVSRIAKIVKAFVPALERVVDRKRFVTLSVMYNSFGNFGNPKQVTRPSIQTEMRTVLYVASLMWACGASFVGCLSKVLVCFPAEVLSLPESSCSPIKHCMHI